MNGNKIQSSFEDDGYQDGYDGKTRNPPDESIFADEYNRGFDDGMDCAAYMPVFNDEDEHGPFEGPVSEDWQ